MKRKLFWFLVWTMLTVVAQLLPDLSAQNTTEVNEPKDVRFRGVTCESLIMKDPEGKNQTILYINTDGVHLNLGQNGSFGIYDNAGKTGVTFKMEKDKVKITLFNRDQSQDFQWPLDFYSR